MKYINAAEILPQNLLRELQLYIEGDILYIPKVEQKKEWGENSGSRSYYLKRNAEIKSLYHAGVSVNQLSEQYGLAYNTIRKIIYRP